LTNSELNDYTNESLALDLLIYRLTLWITLITIELRTASYPSMRVHLTAKTYLNLNVKIDSNNGFYLNFDSITLEFKFRCSTGQSY